MPRAVRWARSTALVVVMLATAGSAAAAYVCHPDPPGTRTLRVTGDVATYAMKGNRVDILTRGPKGCHAIHWNILRGPTSDKGGPDACGASQNPTRSVSRAGRVVSLVAGSADAPDRLQVAAGGR